LKTPADIAMRMRASLARRAARLGLALLVVAPALGAGLSPQAQAQTAGIEASEEKLKAAYLYKFLNYVEWPAASFSGPDAPYQIGVLGDDLVADELARSSAGKTVNDRPLAIRRLAAGDSMNDIDLLFISHSERARQGALLAKLRTLPVLTVTETEGALDAGSIINFRIVDNRVRFEVSLDAADRAGLKLSARLLGVAINVVKGNR
jgi:hypothetical protein